LPDTVTTDELVGPVTVAAVLERWQHARRRPGEVPAPVGATADPAGGEPSPLSIDLIADGPHALIGGTTGAGKSELLRTFVLSLALHHPPDAVSFLLVDYKGGSAFDACAELPHTVGVVTDLDSHLATRALVALDAEIRRREQVLRHAGVADLSTGEVPSLARLVVVIDEFATLAAELPGFLDALVDVAQRAAASASTWCWPPSVPTERSATASTPTRICASPCGCSTGPSRPTSSTTAAARLPRDRPGRGYARFGHDELVPFQSGPSRAACELVEQISRRLHRRGRSSPAPWLHPCPHRSPSTRSRTSTTPATPTTPAGARSPWHWPWPTSPPSSGSTGGAGTPSAATSSSSACPAAARRPRWCPSRSRLPGEPITDGSTSTAWPTRPRSYGR
jgi:S-DNA-T family DNA segregation ATPase FtsK/SpoIIIE